MDSVTQWWQVGQVRSARHELGCLAGYCYPEILTQAPTCGHTLLHFALSAETPMSPDTHTNPLESKLRQRSQKRT